MQTGVRWVYNKKGAIMNKYLVEFIGTFFLILTIALTANPLPIGVVLMCLVYFGASISGAHFNPAVTIAMVVLKKINIRDAKSYIISQMGAATLATFTSYFFFSTPFKVSPSSTTSWMSAVIIEAIFTFLLVSVIAQVALNKKNQNNQFFGLAIGGTVLAAAYAIGGISGGALNPAVGIGPQIANLFLGNFAFDPSLWFLYTIGPVVGAIAAAWTYSFLEQKS